MKSYALIVLINGTGSNNRYTFSVPIYTCKIVQFIQTGTDKSVRFNLDPVNEQQLKRDHSQLISVDYTLQSTQCYAAHTIMNNDS